MADTAIPTYRCTSCLSAVPEDDNQNLLGAECCCLTSDEAENFVAEAQRILRYLSDALADLERARTQRRA